jgi:hypothetical protein
MGRRKLGVWEQALRDASRELGEPKDSFVVERYATLSTLLKLQRSQWAQGKSSNASDVIATLAELESMRQRRGKDAVTEIRVSLIETMRAKCPACGVVSDIPPDMVRSDSQKDVQPSHPTPANQTPTGGQDNAIAGPSTDAPPPADPVPSQYVEGKSPSQYHSQRGVPLKRLQSGIHPLRNLSPLSH